MSQALKIRQHTLDVPGSEVLVHLFSIHGLISLLRVYCIVFCAVYIMNVYFIENPSNGLIGKWMEKKLNGH